MTFHPTKYGPVFAQLLAEERLPPLGPGCENSAMASKLDAATVERAFAHARVARRDMADACLAGAWLYHDFLNRSHTISQSISDATGSYWHGIMHRREPDFSNAGYWFRRVGSHAIFADLASAARELAAASGSLHSARWLADVNAWDPFQFIGLCEACYHSPGEDQTLCRRVSLVEWRLLFDHSYRKATGG